MIEERRYSKNRDIFQVMKYIAQLTRVSTKILHKMTKAKSSVLCVLCAVEELQGEGQMVVIVLSF